MSQQYVPDQPTQQAPAGGWIPVADASVDARFDYMRGVYSLLLGGIAAFVALEAVLFTTGLAETITSFVFGTSWLLVLGAFMLVSWLASSAVWRLESRPAQLAAYGALIAVHALIFTPMLWIARETAPGVIGQAGAVTLVGFVGLTGIAMTSAKDFSFLGSLLRWVGVGALLLIVSAVVFGFSLGTWFSVAMIVFAGGAILFETQQILKQYPVGTEVPAAMSLFSSVALLFWYVLRLFMGRD